MKKLAVLVSLYNAGDFIRNRLDNLMQSTMLDDMEIWCVNANSPDERDDTIPKEYNVRYVRLPERIGVYAAWNHAISNSQSQYICNANADDIVAPDCYERLVGLLQSKEGPGFAYPSWHCTAVPNQQWPPTIDVDFRAGQPGRYAGNIDVAGVGHFPLWSRALHDKLGLFDERFKALGDAEWWARCFYQGKAHFTWINEALACYLWRNGENLWHREINEVEWKMYHEAVARYRQA